MESGATKNIIPRKKNGAGSEGKRKRSDKRRGKKKKERERKHTLNKRINPPVARRER